MNTADCIQLLIAKCPATYTADWKRVRKLGGQERGDSIRVFQNKKTGEFWTVIEEPYAFSGDGVSVMSGNLFPSEKVPGRIAAMKKACQTIRHCGDYGHLYWNEVSESAWLSMGDGDGCDPYTDFDEIRSLLAGAGAKEVDIEAESGPEMSAGYRYVGSIGRSV